MPPASNNNKARSATPPHKLMEEATKDAVGRGKRKVERGAKKVVGVTEQVLGNVRVAISERSTERSSDGSKQAPPAEKNVARENRQGILKNKKSDHPATPSDVGGKRSLPVEATGDQSSPPGLVAKESPIVSSQKPASSKKVERPKMERQNARRVTVAAPNATPDKATFFHGVSTEVILTIYTAIVSSYHAWTCKSDILANQFPLSVVFPFVMVAFMLGYNFDTFLSLFEKKEKPQSRGSRGSNVSIVRNFQQQQRRGGVIYHATPQQTALGVVDTDTQTSIADKSDASNENESSEYEYEYFGRTKQLWRRGRTLIKRAVKTPSTSNVGEGGGIHRSLSNTVSGMIHNQMFFSNLHHPDIEEWETKIKAPFEEGQLMNHLLSYSDFSRHKSANKRRVSAMKGAKDKEADSVIGETEYYVSEKETRTHEREKITDISMGKAINANMSNTRAESLETNETLSIVDPMCELRGMDLFLTDDPEENIYRQPLLQEFGLRDAPTLVSNMMMPFGNLTTYFKLPDWFDDWDNIPEEKEDDPSEVKAMKRFLMGDNEYRNLRAKIVPFVVDGPLAIRLIKPPPMEIDIDGPRHPAKWTNVPKSIDPVTGKTTHALLEVDIDLLSVKAIRRVINIVRPHLQSITIDLAVIVSKPQHSEIEEPSACLGLWRIDKVDFESCAVFPEKTIDETAQQLKLLMSQILEENVAVEVAAG